MRLLWILTITVWTSILPLQVGSADALIVDVHDLTAFTIPEKPGIILRWDGVDPASARKALQAMVNRKSQLLAVLGPGSAWLDVLADQALKPQIWAVIEEGRGGLHYQKVRSTGTIMLKYAKKAREAGLTLGLANHGVGWTRAPDTLIDVAKWLAEYGGASNITIAYKPAAGSTPETWLKTLSTLPDSPKTLILPQGTDDPATRLTLKEADFTGTIAIEK